MPLQPLAILVIATILASLQLTADTDKSTAHKSYPAIPTSALQPYQVSSYEETLETMRLPRLRLIGPKVLQMDPLPDYHSVPTHGECSTRLVIDQTQNFKIEFLAFSTAHFPHALSDATLNLYLQGMQLRQTPEKAFTILEESAFTENGRSKFRIFGQRAMTIRYSVKNDAQTLVCGENWIERGGNIYIVRIQAPAHVFASQFKEARLAFNSLHEVK
ncbi:hypothetical protein QEH59_02930 [Coraliomargarita sp. SDUM461004]|uniref:DUF1795 domain-containing protein n=1 Tax=Thalassobacterium sedimentorum TaxID=3041258 RepID=A0ABU1AF04_9BACT|nr:hypothetical protein [Coraliomargarita sp. SDUM461004]MDQ8193362.1 hypothetical protein [Coraliomargarita sp. SDUM461004]